MHCLEWYCSVVASNIQLTFRVYGGACMVARKMATVDDMISVNGK